MKRASVPLMTSYCESELHISYSKYLLLLWLYVVLCVLVCVCVCVCVYVWVFERVYGCACGWMEAKDQIEASKLNLSLCYCSPEEEKKGIGHLSSLFFEMRRKAKK